MTRRSAAPRRGVTMIELLVVIAVIAVLASLLVVGISRVNVTARKAAATAEIAQISNAIGAFKAKMNVGFIPSGGVVDAKTNPNGLFRLRSQYTGNEFEAIYLKQLFPQLPGCTGVKGETTGLPDVDLDGNQTLVFFLTGGSNVTSSATPFQGFSTNRVAPFTPAGVGSDESRIGPFLEFDAKKYATGLASTGANPDAASLVDAWGSPYAYFAFNPLLNKYDLNQSFTFNGSTVQPYVVGNKVLNAKGFQIISAGDNGKDDQVILEPAIPATPTSPAVPAVLLAGFGPGGLNWTPGQKNYAEGRSGADDVSNFNSGVLINPN